jgi:hypothetical protein
MFSMCMAFLENITHRRHFNTAWSPDSSPKADRCSKAGAPKFEPRIPVTLSARIKQLPYELRTKDNNSIIYVLESIHL